MMRNKFIYFSKLFYLDFSKLLLIILLFCSFNTFLISALHHFNYLASEIKRIESFVLTIYTLTIILLLLAIIAYSIIVIVRDFIAYNTIYTFSLPFKIISIINFKIFNSLLFIILAFLIIFGSIYLLNLSETLFIIQLLEGLIKQNAVLYNLNVAQVIVIICITIVLLVINTLMLIIASFSVVEPRFNNKIIGSIIAYFIGYYLCQFLTLFISVILFFTFKLFINNEVYSYVSSFLVAYSFQFIIVQLVSLSQYKLRIAK